MYISLNFSGIFKLLLNLDCNIGIYRHKYEYEFLCILLFYLAFRNKDEVEIFYIRYYLHIGGITGISWYEGEPSL